MIFYFTSTGNSLYAAKHFDNELYSIPQEMKKENRHYKADRIGIVCPLFEFDLPVLVKDFILNSEFETEYFYIVMTYGMHHGGCAARNAEFFEKAGLHIDYFNTVKMLDNALPVFDIEEQRKLDPEKMDLYDLFYALRIPRRVQFSCFGQRHEAQSAFSGAGITVRFDDTKYASIDDFYSLAAIDGKLLTSLYRDLHGFKIAF